MRIAAIVSSVLLLALSACSRERMDWREAQGSDTLEAYEHFVREHPDGELAASARERIAQLTQQRDWQRAAAADSALAHRTPPAVTAPNATSLAMPSAAPEGYAVQLGAFSSPERAQDAWRVLERSFAAELGGASPRVLAARASDHLYRLQVQMADEAHARAACARLKEQSQPCVVVPPPR